MVMIRKDGLDSLVAVVKYSYCMVDKCVSSVCVAFVCLFTQKMDMNILPALVHFNRIIFEMSKSIFLSLLIG